MKIDIGKTMRDFLPTFQQGLDGIELMAFPEREQEWSVDFAALRDVYLDLPGESSYFDADRFMSDVLECLADEFSTPRRRAEVYAERLPIKVLPARLPRIKKVEQGVHLVFAGTIVIRWYRERQGVEIHRAKVGK